MKLLHPIGLNLPENAFPPGSLLCCCCLHMPQGERVPLIGNPWGVTVCEIYDFKELHDFTDTTIVSSHYF